MSTPSSPTKKQQDQTHSGAVPAPGQRFKIVHLESGRNLFAQKGASGRDGIGAWEGQCYADHWWKAIRVAGGGVHLQNVESKRYLAAHQNRLTASTERPAASAKNAVWLLQPASTKHAGGGVHDGLFQIENAASDRRLYFRADKNDAGVYDAGAYDDQLWALVIDYTGAVPPAAPAETEPAVEESKLSNWLLRFGPDGDLENWEAVGSARQRLRQEPNPNRHLFVMIHGVSEDSGGTFDDYRWRMADLFDEYPALGNQPGKLRRKDVMVLRINWKSGKMITMDSYGNVRGMLLENAVPGLPMASQTLAEKGELAHVLNLLGLADGPFAPTIHLVGHSFGTQVISYLLPKIAESVKIGSIFLIQGFASRWAFTLPKRGFLGGRLPLVKQTNFPDHTFKVKGPIVATVSNRDLEILAAAASGVMLLAIGNAGFGLGASTLELHDLLQDKLEGGKKTYAFAGNGEFNNLVCTDFITGHNDFGNSAVVWAHFHAAGLVPVGFVAPVPKQLAEWPAVPAPDRWMGAMWDTLKRRNLTQLTLPGAHDAGTGVIYGTQPRALTPEKWMLAGGGTIADLLTLPGVGTVISATALTALGEAATLIKDMSRTQVHPIRDQLQKGCRYFDLRPGLTAEGYRLVHVDKKDYLGWIGGVGESLSDVLKAVRRFAEDKAHRHELVVLNFSHFANLIAKDENGKSLSDPAKFQLTEAQKADLVTKIRRGLGTHLITRPDVSPGRPLHAVPLAELMKHGTVLCLFECDFNDLEKGATVRKAKPGPGLWSQRKPEHGIFTFGPWDTDADFRLYDDYSNRPNRAGAIGVQKERFREQMSQRQAGTRDGVFLFSWTITLTPFHAITGSSMLLDYVKPLNADLSPWMHRWIARGDFRGKSRPNILYLDAYDETFVPIVKALNEIPL